MQIHAMSEDFLSRWSRRKTQTRAEGDAPSEKDPAGAKLDATALPPEATLDPQQTEIESEISPDEIAALPPVDTLHADSDFTQFLRRGVPAALKSAALRRLWVSDPGIRDFVGDARDYAWDWNVAGGVPGTGPLAPGTDVEGMVRRVFGDRDVEPPMAPDAAELDVSRAVEDQSADPMGDTDLVDEGTEASASDAVDSSLLTKQGPLAAPGIASVPLEPPNIPQSHPRKHGSATPRSSLE